MKKLIPAMIALFCLVWYPMTTNAGIVDNSDSSAFSYVGAWQESNVHPDKYGANFLFIAGGDGSATATWELNITTPGYYGVYAWWAGHSNRATDAPFTIYYDDGSGSILTDTIDVNQEANSKDWNRLGTETYYFTSVASKIVLSNDADEYVVADAVMVNQVPIPSALWLVGSGLFWLVCFRRRDK